MKWRNGMEGMEWRKDSGWKEGIMEWNGNEGMEGNGMEWINENVFNQR